MFNARLTTAEAEGRGATDGQCEGQLLEQEGAQLGCGEQWVLLYPNSCRSRPHLPLSKAQYPYVEGRTQYVLGLAVKKESGPIIQ